MKDNNKGYLLTEIIVASVLAMIVAYFFIDMTIKIKDKNDDLYVDTVLVTDKALMTKELMNDLNNYKLLTLKKESNSQVNFTYEGLDNPISLIIKKEENGTTIFKYGDYSKTFSSDLTVGTITITTNETENKKNNDAILYIKVPAKTMYSDIDYGINIAIPYNKDIVDIILPPTLEYSIEISEYQKIDIVRISDATLVKSYDYIHNTSSFADENSFNNRTGTSYSGSGNITINTTSKGYYTFCLTTQNGDRILKNVYIENYDGTSSSYNQTINGITGDVKVTDSNDSSSVSFTSSTNSITVNVIGMNSYDTLGGGCDDCRTSNYCSLTCVEDDTGNSPITSLSWKFSCSYPSCPSGYSYDGENTYGSCSYAGARGSLYYYCRKDNCTESCWSGTPYYRTTILVEL